MGDDSVYEWSVTAGFEPDGSAERFTEAFVVTSEDWGGGDIPGRRLRASRQQEALTYLSKLMDEEAFAWVRMDYRSHESPWVDG